GRCGRARGALRRRPASRAGREGGGAKRSAPPAAVSVPAPDAAEADVRVGCRVVIFAKAPEPGAVKTRLVPAIGEEAAAALHARLVKRALSTARRAGVGPVELACDPSTDHPFFRFCAARYGVSL